MKAPTRILIIDPHELVRAGIRLACESKDSLEIVAEADDIVAGRPLVAKHRPDVILLDLANCQSSDCHLVKVLTDEFPQTAIVVFTSADSAEAASRVMAAGASGFLTKIAGLDEIAAAIRCVHAGRTFVSYSTAKRSDEATETSNSNKLVSVVASMASDLVATNASPNTHRDSQTPDSSQNLLAAKHDTAHQSGSPKPNKKAAGLSQREVEVLGFLGEGMTNRQVAERLFLSVKTIETYRARIMKKFDLCDRSELVRFARSSMSDDSVQVER